MTAQENDSMPAPRRCLVFGGSGVLGAAVCRALAAKGARVAFTYHRGEAAAQALARELPDTQPHKMDAASKAALVGMVQAMAKEVGESAVKINVVAPGIMEAGISRALPDDLRRDYLEHCGLKRVGRLEEIANVATWLALHNTYITGQTILVDGGL